VWLTLGAAVAGSILMYAAASVTHIQAGAPARLRGRPVSIFAMFQWGMTGDPGGSGRDSAEPAI
jgi:hypothetical protein